MRRTYIIEYETSSEIERKVEVEADDLLGAISMLYSNKTTIREIKEIHATVLVKLYDRDDGGLGSPLDVWDTCLNRRTFREGAAEYAAQQEALKKGKS